MDYNAVGIKLNLYWNNYSTSSLRSYIQTSIKGNSRCNTPLTPTISCKYVTSYPSSLLILISSLEPNKPTYQPLEVCSCHKVYYTPGGQLQGQRFHAPDGKLP
jgi:hypothetical protein